jgi:hypothetical protein
MLAASIRAVTLMREAAVASVTSVNLYQDYTAQQSIR